MKEMDSSMMGGIKTSYGPECYAMRMCPTEAISNYFLINKELCINCGTCTHQCAMGVFNARLGSIELAHTKIDYGHICGETNEKIYSVSPQQSAENGLVNEASELSWLTIPVTLRQSNRARAEELCTILKNRILNKEFPINRMKGPLKYNEGNVPKVP